jgi:hypothetical protein
MQVGAVSTPQQPDWRWRIVNYAGEIIEESRGTFATIALAVANGTEYLRRLDADVSVPRAPYRSTSYLRTPRGTPGAYAASATK